MKRVLNGGMMLENYNDLLSVTSARCSEGPKPRSPTQAVNLRGPIKILDARAQLYMSRVVDDNSKVNGQNLFGKPLCKTGVDCVVYNSWQTDHHVVINLTIERFEKSLVVMDTKVVLFGNPAYRIKRESWARDSLLSCFSAAGGEKGLGNNQEEEELYSESLLHKLPGNARFNHLSHGDAPGEVFKPGPAEANRPPRQWVEAPSSGSLSSLPSLASGTQHSLASTLSIEPQEDQHALRRVPPSTGPQDSRLSKSYLAPLIMALSGPALLHHCLSFFSWWWATAEATFFSTWAHGKSQQEHLSHRPPDTVFWEGPAHWQAEAGRGDHCFIHPDVQKLLEMLISKRVKQKICQEKRKGGSFFQPVNTDYPRVSLRNLLRSLGDKLTCAQPFCNTKGRAEWLLGSQQVTFHKVVASRLEHECSLFWGLPSLHSESLVAPAWVAKRSSSTGPQSFKFNEVPAHISGQSQDEGPLQNLSPFMPCVQHPAHFPSSPLKPPPPSPPRVRACKTTCPASQEKAWSFVPNENQDLEWTLQKPLKWRKALNSKLQKAREAIRLPTLNLPQGSQASEAPESESIISGDSTSAELQEKPGCHRPGAFNRDEGRENLPHPAFRFLPSQDLMQHLGKLPRKCEGQAQNSHGPIRPTQPSAPACGSSKAVQNTGSWHSGSLFNKGLVTLNLQDIRNVPQDANTGRKDASWSTGSTSRKVQGDKDAQSDIMGPERYDSESHFSRGPDKKHLQKGLQDHLSRKLGQINEGMIPVRVRKSWLTAKHTLPRSNIHSQPINVKYSKGQEKCVNTSHVLAFLDPRTHLFLEAHIKNYQLRHKWGPLFQNLEPRNIHVGEAQALPPPQPTFASSAPCDSRADFTAKLASFQQGISGKIPRQKKTTKIPFPSLQSPLPATRSPAWKEVQRSGTGTPYDHKAEPSDILPTAQEAGLPSAACTQQSSTVLGIERVSPVPTPCPAMAKYDPGEGTGMVALQSTCHSIPMLEIKLVSPLSVAKEGRKPEVEEKQPAWEVTVGASMMEETQNINISLRTLGSQDTSNHSSHSNQAPDVRRKVDNHLDINTHREGENWSQDVSTGSLQDCHTKGLLSTGIWPSQASLSSSQGMAHSNTPTTQFLCDHSMNRESSQGQQEPSMSRFQDTGKSNSKMSGPIHRRKNYRKPGPGDEEQSRAALGISHSCELSPAAQVREADSPGSMSSAHPPEEGQAPPESLIEEKRKHFLPCSNTNKQRKGQEDSMQKPKPSSAPHQGQTSVTNRVVTNREEAKVQMLLKVVGQILVEKLGLHGSAPSGLNSHKAEPPEPVGRRSCCHRAPSSPDKRRVVKDVACAHYDSPSDHSHPAKGRWIRDRFSNQALLPQEPVPPNQSRPSQANRHRNQRATAFVRMTHHPTTTPPQDLAQDVVPLPSLCLQLCAALKMSVQRKPLPGSPASHLAGPLPPRAPWPPPPSEEAGRAGAPRGGGRTRAACLAVLAVRVLPRLRADQRPGRAAAKSEETDQCLSREKTLPKQLVKICCWALTDLLEEKVQIVSIQYFFLEFEDPHCLRDVQKSWCNVSEQKPGPAAEARRPTDTEDASLAFRDVKDTVHDSLKQLMPERCTENLHFNSFLCF
ncbi:spermatogenesis-associated protein 31E1 [Erethizon dorsatum]